MRKQGKTLKVCFLLALLLAVSVLFPAQVRADNQGARDAMNGVVYVQEYLYGAKYVTKSGKVLQNFGDTPSGHGSGFFVGKPGEKVQYIVTNQHVIDDYWKSNKGGAGNVYCGTTNNGIDYFLSWEKMELRIYFDDNDYVKAFVVEANDVDTNEDYALLRIDTPTDKRTALKLKRPTSDMKGSSVFALGFPGASDNELTSGSDNRKGKDHITMTSGIISEFGTTERGIHTIATDAQISPGNSGGPLVTEEGYVVGIDTWTISPGSNHNAMSYAVSAEHIMEMLTRNKVEFATGDSSGSSGGSGSGSGDGSGSGNGGGSGSGSGGSSDSKGGGILIFLAIGAVVVAIAVVVVVVVVASSKKKPASSPVSQQTPGGAGVQMQRAKRPMVRMMSAQYQARTVDINKSCIFIGRDSATCDVVFRENSPGVSRKHCSVSYDAASDTFTVMDLGSSYGTFLMNGQKLQPNVGTRLRNGEAFYVGDKANVIKVELG